MELLHCIHFNVKIKRCDKSHKQCNKKCSWYKEQLTDQELSDTIFKMMGGGC